MDTTARICKVESKKSHVFVVSFVRRGRRMTILRGPDGARGPVHYCLTLSKKFVIFARSLWEKWPLKSRGRNSWSFAFCCILANGYRDKHLVCGLSRSLYLCLYVCFFAANERVDIIWLILSDDDALRREKWQVMQWIVMMAY